VAVVREVAEDSVFVIQQNWANNDADGAYRVAMTRSGNDCSLAAFGGGSYTINGWLRIPGEEDGDDDDDAADDDDDDTSETTPESCNGLAADGDGLIAEDWRCWTAVYRFRSQEGAYCWSTSTSPPSACLGYTLDVEAWVVPAYSVPGTYEMRQCSRLTDHILVERGSADHDELESAGYDCSEELGHPYAVGQAPSSAQLPFDSVCPLWRFAFDIDAYGAHLFTKGPDDLTAMTCESPERAEVLTDHGCFGAVPAGC